MGNGRVHRLFGDGRFNREILERITAVSILEWQGKLLLKIDLRTDDLQLDWLAREAVFRLIVNGGERVLEGRYSHIFRLGPEPPYYIEVDFHNLETGNKEEIPGERNTLEAVISAAGNVEKHFEVKRAS